MNGHLKILFVSDTHLGFDYPFKPRVKRRRRGDDFFANYRRVLALAVEEQVDCLIHGGDILYRSKIPAQLVNMAFEPLADVTKRGIPVFVVPGNHERSHIPFRLLAAQPGIHIFTKPRTFLLRKNEFTLALSGFPYHRDNVRAQFPAIIEKTGYRDLPADARLLCMHHCVEGSVVKSGNREHVFKFASDVIRINDIPADFSAALSGHIHRFQVLTRDLSQQLVATPVFYPGSIERTSFAEKDETKGFLMMRIATDGPDKGTIRRWRFHPLPARPMREVVIDGNGVSAGKLKAYLQYLFANLPADAVVKIRWRGDLVPEAQQLLRTQFIRALAPATMNIELSPIR